LYTNGVAGSKKRGDGWSQGTLRNLVPAAEELSDRGSRMSDEEQNIHELFDGADRALMAADIEALSRVFADDYVQYDAAGRAFPKRQVLENLRSAAVRYPVIKSTARRVRLLGDMAIVHGAEMDEVETGGKRFPVHYLYMDVVLKREGRWQIVGSQLVKPAE
jgi:uncharacterized protein (TIGR02246 family)